MPTFPNATALTSSTVTTGTVFPCSESSARNEITAANLFAGMGVNIIAAGTTFGMGTATAYQEYVGGVLTNAALSVAGAVQARAGNNVHVLTSTLTGREVMALIHRTNGNTFSALTARRYDGLETMGLGYGNPGGNAPFADTVFIESSRFWNYDTNAAGSGSPPDIAVVQSEYDNGGAGQSLRRRMLFNGSDYSSVLAYRKGAASGAGIPTGNIAALTVDANGKSTFAGSSSTSDAHNVIINGSAIRSLKLQCDYSQGYSAAFFHDNGGVERGAMGWGNASAPSTDFASCAWLATFSTSDPVKLMTNALPRLTITGLGSAVMGTAAVATNATDGFFYVAGCAGTPSGTPTAFTGRVPLVVDTTNHKLYFYSGGSWRDAGP